MHRSPPAGSLSVDPEEFGLVGTPYFWTGIASAVGAFALLMLALWG